MSAQPQKRKPGWMSIPGGPKEPSFQEFRARLDKKNDEKRKLFDKLASIRNQLSERPDDAELTVAQKEQRALRDRMRQIDDLRRKEIENRNAKNDDMSRIRKQKYELDQQLRDLSMDLGAFKDLSEIEHAIDRVLFKMETGSGSLRKEKLCAKRISQLEQAKALVQRLAPLQDQLDKTEEEEEQLQTEYRDIHERINELNKQYKTQAAEKASKDQNVKRNTVDKSALFKERDDTRTKINTIIEDIGKVRADFDAQKEEWAKWREIAIEKHRVQQEEIRAERERRMKEREEQMKKERKARKVLERRNPFENEIDICSTLIRYLSDKASISKQNKEKAIVKKKVASFDPNASAPSGATVVARDDEWFFTDRTKAKKAQKAAAQQAKPKETQPNKDKYLQHNVERFRSFEKVSVEIPMTIGAIPAALEELKKKKAEYETHIGKTNEDDVSDEEEEEEQEEKPAASPKKEEAAAAEE